MRATRGKLIVFEALMLTVFSNCIFAEFGTPDPSTLKGDFMEMFPYSSKSETSTDIIVGSVEAITCKEYNGLLNFGDTKTLSISGTRLYEIKVITLVVLKGNIAAIKDVRDKNNKLITISFKGLTSPFNSPETIYKPSLREGFLNTTGLFIFFLKRKTADTYELAGDRFSALPFFPVEDVDITTMKNPWDYIIMTLGNERVPIDIHTVLYQYLIDSDISDEEKQAVSLLHKKYLNAKIKTLTEELNKLEKE